MNMPPSLPRRPSGTPRRRSWSENIPEWPFFVLLTLAFAFIYAWSVINAPALQVPLRLILFTVLMVVHTTLHWLSWRLPSWRWVAYYLVLQTGLAFTIVFLAGNSAPLVGLYMGLIGETIGLLREKVKWAVFGVVVCLGLSLLNYGIMSDWAGGSWWMLASLPMTLFVIVYVVLYSRQAEARARAQALLKDLEVANRQLSEYAARVEDLTVAAERQRMARELHDTLSQGLAGLILQLEAVDAHLARERAGRAREILQQTMERARATLTDARRAIDDLRKPAPPDLKAAVRQEIDRFTDSTGIPCAAEIDLPAGVPEIVSETVLRAISESLTNIAQHAQAHAARLRLIGLEDALEVEVGDDGIGFDLSAIQAGHYGLLGMRERVRLAGGSFEVQSGAGRGTQIKIRFPLEKVAHA